MKKLILIVAAIFAVSAAAAQNRPNWGVKGGLNIASENIDNASTSPKAGIYVGGFAEWYIGRVADFQLEALFSMQGGKYKPNSTTYTDKINYINAPLIFKFYVIKQRSLSIDVGPQVGYMVSAKYSNGSTTTSFYDNDKLNKFDASFAIGTSYKFPSGVDVSVRFVAGMTKIMSSSDHKNSVVQMGAGYRF